MVHHRSVIHVDPFGRGGGNRLWVTGYDDELGQWEKLLIKRNRAIGTACLRPGQ
tara:strand:- start:7649 stop:7810 length:162 start_codon:yes stop_codon:yes gene_type:complete